MGGLQHNMRHGFAKQDTHSDHRTSLWWHSMPTARADCDAIMQHPAVPRDLHVAGVAIGVPIGVLRRQVRAADVVHWLAVGVCGRDTVFGSHVHGAVRVQRFAVAEDCRHGHF